MPKTQAKVRVRFAPSPTGWLHIGGLRTALFNYLFAKKNKGVFILRIEDTDQERFVPGATEKLISTLDNFGLKVDEGVFLEKNKVSSRGKYGPYIQSQKLKNYQKAAQELVSKEKAYYCFCSAERLEKLRNEQKANKKIPKYDGLCRDLDPLEAQKRLKMGQKAVVRYKIPSNSKVVFKDLIYGQISVNSEDLDDFVILKSDGFPTYHLANIIDDHDMQISHVIRGEEWLPSLPKHVLLYQAFGYQPPIFIHLPLLLNPDRSKLSKRQGDVAAEDFLNKGYLPAAIINYVALLGWNPGTEQEVFDLAALIKSFSLEKIHKAGAIFDLQKLNWFNAEYVRQTISQKNKDYKNLLQTAEKFLPQYEDKAAAVLKLFGNRINNLSELTKKSEFLWKLPKYEAQNLIFKKSTKENTKKGLELAIATLQSLPDKKWQEEILNSTLQELLAKNNLTPGDLFWPLRYALSGLEKSPSPAEILEFLGKEESLQRIKLALKKL